MTLLDSTAVEKDTGGQELYLQIKGWVKTFQEVPAIQKTYDDDDDDDDDNSIKGLWEAHQHHSYLLTFSNAVLYLQVIEVKFEKFDVEQDNYCRYDYVAIFNGGEINDAKRIGKYCGDRPPAPIVSEQNELLVQFLSDLSLTADGFIGHYKFRPKKLPTTTVPPVTTTSPVPTSSRPTVALCLQKCRRSGTLESNYCSSNFVLAGTVITTMTKGGSLHATVSIINVYKEGNLAIQQAGKNMSTKITVVCKQCPLIRRGLNYIIMGQVDEDGRGKITPNSFIMNFKMKNQKILNALKNKRC
ncbi:procollagen C-endopeptidase enhancer 2 [Sarcophilus harrisii]